MAPLLIIIFLGGYFLTAGVFVLSLITIREYCNAFGERKPSGWVMITSLIILYAGFLIPIPLSPWFVLLWVFVSLVLCFLSMFAMEKRDLLQGMATITGVFYINFLAFHIVLVDETFTQVLPVGKFWFSGLNSYVWIIALAAFGTDIFAYFTGNLFGKHKLCPSISPKKTVEGSIGGIIGSVILCGIFGWFFIPEGFVNCIIIGFAGSLISQIGDLSASVMKRKIGIKDWGTLIPGHGGVLDRIDSMLFTAPLVFYFLLFKEIIFQI
jgi:phosphatidate cytidylyltransferase